jgi:cytochrome c-type biogenesis protein CcmH
VSSNLIYFLLSVLVLILIVILVFYWRERQFNAAQKIPDNEALKANAYQSELISQSSAHQEHVLAQAQIFKAQLADLELERSRGLITEEEFAQAHDEMARRLLEDTSSPSEPVPKEVSVQSAPKVYRYKWLMVSLSVFLFVASLGLYLAIGQPEALDPKVLAEGTSHEEQFNAAQHAKSPEMLAKMAKEMQERLEKEPNSVEAWTLLARVQRARENFAEANEAYKKSLSLSSNDDVAIERAEVLAMLNQGRFEGESMQIIESVLKADPDQANALLLGGSAAFSQGKYPLALERWTRVRKQLDPNSSEAQSVDQVIALTQEKLGIKPPPSQAKAKDAGFAQASIKGQVVLSDALANKVEKTDSVFVYATDPQGSRMPIAILKTKATSFPLSFELNDDLAMSPERKLSQFSEVLLHVRISKTGQAIPEPSDLGLTTGPILLGAKNLQLRVEGSYKSK